MKQSVNKHLHYYYLRAKVTLMQMAEYRTNMFSVILGTYGYSLMTLFFLDVLFRNINSLAGWDINEIFILFAVGQFIFYLYWILFGSVHFISELISSGEFDRYLVKPLNTYFKITTENFNLVETFPSLLIPIVLFILNWDILHLQFGINFLIAVISFLISLIIYLLSYQCLGLMAFWLTDTNELITLYGSLDFVHYPTDIYPKIIRPVFLTIIPIGLVAYVPTTFLLRGFRWDLFLYQLGTLIFFITLTRILWIRGLRNYSSASS